MGYRSLLNGVVGSDMKHMMKPAPGYEFLATSMSVADSKCQFFMTREGDFGLLRLSLGLCVCVHYLMIEGNASAM